MNHRLAYTKETIKKLIQSLQKLKKNGNSVIVVEHDKEIMESADFIVDIGPKAGFHGGSIVSKGTYSEMLKSKFSHCPIFERKKQITVPKKRRDGNGKSLELFGASGNNLKKIDFKLKLGTLTCITELKEVGNPL